MSKTLTGLLETVAGVALEFVPGFQAIGTALIVSGVTTAATGLFSGTAKPDQAEAAVKSGIPVRVSAYGVTRLTRAYLR